MSKAESKKIFDQEYIDTIVDVLDYIISTDDMAEAKRLLNNLRRAVGDHADDLKLKPELQKFYKISLTKLQFIALPLLEDGEVMDLIKRNLSIGWLLPDYDLIQKIQVKLVGTVVFEERNKFRDSLKSIILQNQEIITPQYKVKTTADWIKDYVSHVGLENPDKLIKAQYLLDIKSDKAIKSEQYRKLEDIFNLYDFLSIRSDSPFGFEEEPPVAIDGKLYIFRKGVLEPVAADKNKIKAALDLVGELKDDPGTDSGENYFHDNKIYSNDAAVFRVLGDESSVDIIANLESTLADYPPSSLEHKAIKQEISRLKAAGLRQAQQGGNQQVDTRTLRPDNDVLSDTNKPQSDEKR